MKELFGCVRVCCLFVLLYIFSIAFGGLSPVLGNNIRVDGKTSIVNFVGNDTAVIEVKLLWDNSWRDDFNWDAAWVFFKFKKRGLENPWQHAYLSSSGHTLTPLAGNEGGGYANMVGVNGGKVNGLYVMRNSISEGNVHVRLQVKWPLSGTGLSRSDFGEDLNKIYVAVHAIEMVYIPYGAYYLGDGTSHLCFHEYFAPDRNPIRQNGYESLSASSIYLGSALPEYAIDNDINTNYHSAGNSDEWLMIDFGEPKEMRYFTIRTHYGGTGYYLEGSNDGTAWSVLWSGNGSAWSQTLSKHTISSPDSYRFYRFRETGNYLVIYDVALMEDASAVVVDSEDALTLCVKGDNAFISLSASYPKGYAGFYMMKYETSQEQYVEFLNSLTLEQQKARVMNNNFAQMKKGDYVFGDLQTPSCRNGIAFVEQRGANAPVVFGNNLNPGNDFFHADDGQTLACNYMSVEDMIAYCSWSGLRPMSELEYEKACRRFYPQMPEKGEYAWNTSGGINALSSLSELVYVGDEREQANSVAKNVNSGTANRINGPVRCGLFATSATNQSQSGATYWGVMEMSGNLKELCANVSYSNLDGGSCGTGVYNAAYWNTSVSNYGVRGGGFSSADSLLRTSDRMEAMNYFSAITQRDSTVGFRGVYSLSGITIDGGIIENTKDTACWSGTDIVNLQAASCPDFPDVRFQYNWYVKKPGEVKFDIVDNAGGESLLYQHFENKTTAPVVYTFRRTGICAMGVAESNEVTVTILPEPFAQSVYDLNAGGSVTLTQYWGTNASALWRLDGAPSWAYVYGTAANSLTIAGGLANSEFLVKAKLAGCPSDEFSATVRINSTFVYTGQTDSVTLVAGKYKMECWGGGSGGAGGYTKGELDLIQQRKLYVYVGQAGKGGGVPTGALATFNGGGAGGNGVYYSSGRYWCAGGPSGGGASDIRLMGSVWNNTESLRTRLMIAGGGGGTMSVVGGAAGGLTGYNSNSSGGATVAGATQTSGYALGMGQTGGSGSNAGNGAEGNGGGGGGYYGGQAYTGTGKNSNAGAGGGSSFISGHNGCNAINSGGSHTGQSIHYSGLYFTNTIMIDGAGYQWTTAKGGYVGMPNLTGSGTMNGNTSHGQVKITPL